MSPKIFVPSVLAYISGEAVLHPLYENLEYEIVTLVRNGGQAEQVTKVRPKALTVTGDLDSSELLVKEVAKADLVLSKSARQRYNSYSSPSYASGIRQIPSVYPTNPSTPQTSHQQTTSRPPNP